MRKSLCLFICTSFLCLSLVCAGEVVASLVTQKDIGGLPENSRVRCLKMEGLGHTCLVLDTSEDESPLLPLSPGDVVKLKKGTATGQRISMFLSQEGEALIEIEDQRDIRLDMPLTIFDLIWVDGKWTTLFGPVGPFMMNLIMKLYNIERKKQGVNVTKKEQQAVEVAIQKAMNGGLR
jgi:hypothetical protein